MTLDGLVVRLARREDVAAIVTLLAQDDIGGAAESSDAVDLPIYLDQFDRIAASPDDALFVATLDDVVVGTFQMLIARSLTYRASTRAILEAVQVDPRHRGRRIGEAMVRFAMEEALAHGARKLTLTSNLRRSDAHRFYERLGFTRSHAGFSIPLT